MPSSTIRAASTMNRAIRREVTKPWVSFLQTIVSLPYRPARSSATARVSSEVSTPRTTSISPITGGGLNQWLPITRSGRPVAAASREMENCDVFEASTTSSRQAASSRASTSHFTSSTSTTVSMTWSAEAAAPSRSVVPSMRPRTAAAASGPCRAEALTARSSPRSMRFRPRADRGVVHLDDRDAEPGLGHHLRDAGAHDPAAAHHHYVLDADDRLRSVVSTERGRPRPAVATWFSASSRATGTVRSSRM